MRRNLSFLFTTIGARQCHDWLNRLPRYTVCLSIVAFYSPLAEDLIRGSSFFSVTLYQSVFADNERAGALCKDCKGPLLRWYPLDEVFVFHCRCPNRALQYLDFKLSLTCIGLLGYMKERSRRQDARSFCYTLVEV